MISTGKCSFSAAALVVLGPKNKTTIVKNASSVKSTAIIDLRSDTVTRPSQRMFDSMSSHTLGDDGRFDCPTTIKLQK